jgi:diadenosine tetraphosphate (Ap4A) HIT family hydrolase
MPHFALHPRLAADTVPVGELPLCSVLLTDDARFPWLILVPRRPGLREIVDLPAEERAVLVEEVAAASRALQAVSGAEKLNVAAIGNVVAQLHVHVVARFAADAAWPEPVWGRGSAVRYGAGAARERAQRVAAELGLVRCNEIG